MPGYLELQQEGRRQEENSLTEDLNILPSNDIVRDTIKRYAEEIAGEIKAALVQQAKLGYGKAVHTPSRVGDLYMDDVIASLRKWAKLYGYTLTHHNGTFTVYAKCVEAKKKRCPTCREYTRKLKKIIGGITFGLMGLATAVAMGYGTMYHSNTGNGGYVALCIVGCGATLFGTGGWLGIVMDERA